MSRAEPDPFVLLATLSDPAAAEICAALLRSDGIESRRRGESLGPYRLTIGAMAATQVWVPLSLSEEARRLLELSDLGEVELPERATDRVGAVPSARWGALATVLLMLLAAVGVWALIARLF